MKLPRLTTRRLMILVGIAALAILPEISRRRGSYSRLSTDRCERVEASHLWMAESHRRVADVYREHLANPRESARYNREQIGIFMKAAQEEQAKADAAKDRADAFRRVVICPWVSLPPEEPEPVGPDRRLKGDDRLRITVQNAKPAASQSFAGH